MSHVTKLALEEELVGPGASNTDESDRIIQISAKQNAIINAIQKICSKYDIPVERARSTARYLLEDKFISSLKLPNEAPFLWVNRDLNDEKLNPIKFLNKHWKRYIDDGVLTQKDLQLLDKPLFDAIKYYCRNNNLDTIKYLPPPSRLRIRSCQTDTSRNGVSAKTDRPRLVAAGKRINAMLIL